MVPGALSHLKHEKTFQGMAPKAIHFYREMEKTDIDKKHRPTIFM